MYLTEKQIKRHKRAYNFLKWLLRGWVCHKFAYSFEPAHLPEAPYIVLANHNAELDPLLLGLTFPHTYYVASEHLFNKGLLTKLLVRYFAPIPRMKGRADAATVLDIRRRLLQGCNIGIFPEGNRSLDGRTMRPHPSTGALVRSCKVPVVTFKFTGAYLTSPRWSLSLRKGQMTGQVVNIYYPEQLQSLTADEINEIIYADIYEDAYQTQFEEMTPYIGNNLAAGLETALFLCPSCKQIGRMRSDGDYFRCECGMNTKYNQYGYFTGDNIRFKNYTEWYTWQVEELKKYAYDTYTRFFISDSGLMIFKINKSHSRERLRFTDIKINRQQLVFSGKNSGNVTFDCSTITGMSIYGRNSIVIEIKQDYYELKADKKHSHSFNARKYLHLYDFIKCDTIRGQDYGLFSGQQGIMA
ncbi:MAG: hypothetical protein CVU97_01395 [Firmicutes bacterium HGW-Firmicutes-21]|nr:MAG: hypothetical protein CVU97_01395 [Firmicutes bacterium HGW-Firmicutes-21]